ncbi:MAG: carbohydrate kinase [Planctomycetota bacterium]
MSQTYDVLGIGEVLWDLQPDGRQLGGAPGNFAYHCHAQGLRAAPISAVGDDDEGSELLQTLQDRGVDTSLISALKDVPTGTVDVELDNGKPTYTIHESVAWDRIPMTDDALAAARSARAVCYGTLAQRDAVSRETILQLLDATKPDCLRVFDVNLRQSFYDADIVDGGLRRATVFKLSDDETDEVGRLLKMPLDPEPFGEALFERYPNLSLLVLTRGGDGSLLRRRDGEQSDQPTLKSEVKSTVGAGDSFTAGVVTGLLQGRPLAETHAFASKLAAFVVSQSGAMPELPDDLKL